MALAPVDDWTVLPGINAEVRLQGSFVCEGKVDLVTDDGQILWIFPRMGTRKLFEKTDHYELWAVADSLGRQYRMAKTALIPG